MTDHIFDAKSKPLGRLASEIAHVLQGKHSVKYAKNISGEGRVIVKNIKDLMVTGKKAEQKIYYRHTGYMGHLKEKSYKQAYAANPGWILKHAVLGMLPKNFLRAKRIKRLIIE